jgi:hypothetical protein
VTALARWEWSVAERVGASRSGLLYKMVLAPVRLGGAQKVYCVKGLVGEEWGYSFERKRKTILLRFARAGY